MKGSGRCLACVAAILMLICMALEIAACMTPWWRSSTPFGSVDMNLWHFQPCTRPGYGCTESYDIYQHLDCDGDGVLDHMCTTTINGNRWLVLSTEGCPTTWGTSSRSSSQCQVRTAFGSSKITWDEFCDTTTDQKWCHRIRAMRATTILAAIFSLFALAGLMYPVCKENRTAICGSGATLLSFLFVISAMGISFLYHAESSLKDPDVGVVLICSAVFLSLLAVIFSFIAQCCCMGKDGSFNQDHEDKGWGSWRPQGGPKQAGGMPPSGPPAMAAPPSQYPPAQYPAPQYVQGGVAPPSGQNNFGLPPPSIPAQQYGR